MADGQEQAGLSSLAALRRENSNMQESFYTSLYMRFASVHAVMRSASVRHKVAILDWNAQHIDPHTLMSD